jgi:hypothetical protein
MEDSYGVNITKNDAGIVVTFPYNLLLVEKIKTIPCHKWHPEKKYRNFLQKSCTQQNQKFIPMYAHRA